MKQLFKKLAVPKKKRLEPEVVVKKPFSQPLFFVHIPKTAGTSLRRAIEEHGEIERDYGPESRSTTPLIIEELYQKNDRFQFNRAFSGHGKSIAGHVGIQKYSELYDVRKTVTFVREPLSQVISHYNHYVNHNDFQGDFTEFYQRKGNVNLQSRFLAGIPLTLIGYVGIKEYYAESLALINRGLSLGLEVLEMNKRPMVHRSETELETTQRDELTHLNQSDTELYKLAVEIHKSRIEMNDAQKSWTHIHAHITPNDVIHGCAFSAEHDEVIELELEINGQPVQPVISSEFYGNFPKFKLPRDRYIGFRIPLKQWRNKTIDSLTLVVINTGQKYTLDVPARWNEKRAS